MNAKEAAMLCCYVSVCCPQQRVDDRSPDAWLDLLGDLEYRDAKMAAATVARRQPFVSPSEIRAEVRRMRAERIVNHPAIEPPADMDPAEYLAWIRAARARIASGETIAAPELPPARPLRLQIVKGIA